MKKFLITFFVIIVVAAAAVYFASEYVFDIAAQKVLPRLIPQLAERGIHVDDYDYKSIRLSSPRTITVYDVRTTIDLQFPGQPKKLESAFYAEKVNFHIADIKDPAVFVSCDNFQLYVDRSGDVPGTSFGRFDHGYVKLRDPIKLSDPRAGIKNMLEKVSDLFNENDVDPNMILRAQVTLSVHNKESQAYLYTVREGGSASLRFEEKDIRKMTDTFELELSDEEVAIIAKYPIRAPLIMRITSDAKDTSRDAHKRDRSVPEDAYRHVLWSFLLTQKFGQEFAEMVTDAHETLPTNTAAERKMDYHNNEVGRGYAERGIKKNQILSMVNTDRNVIKYPDQAERF